MSKLGKPKKATDSKNCLTCTKFGRCKDPNKGFSYRCSKYEAGSADFDLDLFNQGTQGSTSISEEDGQFKVPAVPKQSGNKNNKSSKKSSKDRIKEYPDDFDINSIIDNVLENEGPVPPDIRVDDSQMPQAKNFYEFTTDRHYLNITPYPRQLEAGIRLFSEWCPNCSTKKWWKNLEVDSTYEELLENVVLLEKGVCPSCGGTKSEFIRNKRLKPYTEAALLWGQRSGKSALLGGMLSTYVLHGFLKLQNPARAMGLLESGSVLHGTFVALTFNQAKDTLWDPFYEIINSSPWFQEYHSMLDDYSERYGEELYKVKDTFIQYRHRDLLIYPSGPDRRKLRGRTRFLSACDEIGWFNAQQGNSIKYDAHEIYKALKNSQRTIVSSWRNLIRQGYNHIPPPLFGNISSPASQYDMIVYLYERSKRSRTIFGKHLATWEVNPDIPYEDLEEEFEEDSDRAWRDFGAVPPLSSSAFIREIDTLRNIVDKTKRNAGLIQSKVVKTKSKKEMMSGQLKLNWQDDRTRKIMALDAGEVNNHFAMSIGHNEIDYDEEDGKVYRAIFDFMGEVIPSKDHSINFTKLCDDVLLPLIDKMGVTTVVADRWQSTKLLSYLEEHAGVEVGKFSLKYGDFDTFREDVFNGMIQVPRPEIKPDKLVRAGDRDYPEGFRLNPVSHFIFQCLTVQDHAGKGVTKGEKTTDDIFRATVLAHSYLVDPEFKDQFQGTIDEKSGGGISAIMGRSTSFTPDNRRYQDRQRTLSTERGGIGSVASGRGLGGSQHVMVYTRDKENR